MSEIQSQPPLRPSENELKLMLSLIIAGRTLIRTSFAVFTCLPKNYPRFAAAYGPSLPVKTDAGGGGGGAVFS